MTAPQLELPLQDRLSVKERILGHLLHVANAGDMRGKHYFYWMKGDFLEAHGRPDGWDRQEIVNPCWSCDGTGVFYHASGMPDSCNKCWGGGVYSVKKYRLQRFLYGGRIYHIPEDNFEHSCGIGPFRDTIYGRIRHGKPKSLLSATVAFLLLALLIDRQRLWRWLKAQPHYRPTLRKYMERWYTLRRRSKPPPKYDELPF